jgi:hypothetical protein
VNLQEAISQQITLGQKDPLEIARRIGNQFGPEWISGQLLPYAEDFISDMARRQLGARRRAAEVALRPGNDVANAEFGLVSMWIPGSDGVGFWKRAADLTAEDLEARARRYDGLALGSMKRAKWLREVVSMMAAEGVRTLGLLQAALPSLPDDDLYELVAG